MKRALFFALIALGLATAMQSTGASIALSDFNIQKGEADTNTAAPLLYISAVDGNSMNFSCDDSSYGSWVDYANTYSFNLNTGAGCTTGDGAKTVYIKVQDENANQATGSDSINLDTTGPTLTSTWHDANASDVNSNINENDTLIVRIYGDADANAYVTFAGIGDQNLFDDGAHNDIGADDGVYGSSFDVNDFADSSTCPSYLSGKLVDSVGNETTKNSFTRLCLDLNRPEYSNEMPKNYTGDTTPDINIRLLDTGSGIDPAGAKMWVAGSSASSLTRTAITNGYLISYTPSSALSAGSVSVGIYVLDFAGTARDINWTFTIDTAAPTTVSDLNAKTVSGTNDLNVYWSAVSDTGGSGLSHHVLYRYTAAITAANLSSATIISSSISSLAINYIDDMNVPDEDITYFYAIKVADSAGNLSAISNSPSALVPDLNAPTDLNIYIPYYINVETPQITISGTDAVSAKLGCNDVNYSALYTSLSISTFAVTDQDYGCTDADGNITIYAIVYDNHDNNANTTRSVYLDRNAPVIPAISSAEYSDGNNTVIWGEATDVGGGMSHYRVYYGTASGVTTSNSYVLAYDINYSHKVTGRAMYCYKVMAVDLAENLSGLSEEQCLTGDANAPTISISIDRAVKRGDKTYVSAENRNVTVTANYELKSASGWVEFSDGNRIEFTLSGTGSTFEGIVELWEIDGNAVLHIDANDMLDLNTSGELEFYIDATPPKVRDLQLTQEAAGVLNILVQVSTETATLELAYMKEGVLQLIAELKEEDFNNGIATLDWNIPEEITTDVNIVARAFDDVGNLAEFSSLKLLVQGAGEKIARINSIQASLDAAFKLLEDYLLEPSAAVSEKFDTAKAHLKSARGFMNSNEIAEMGEEIAAASRLLSEIESEKASVSVSNAQEINYANEKDFLRERLFESLTGSALLEAKALWDKLEFRREIQSIEITSGRSAESQVIIVIRVKNSSGERIEPFNVVEKVPKEVSEKASLLAFNTIFEILEEDPVVSVFIPGLEPGEERVIKYRSKKALTRDALAMVEANSVSLFDIPVPLPQAFNPREVAIGGPQQGVIPLPIIVIIAGAIAAYLVWRVRREIA